MSTELLHQQDYDARHGNSREAFDFEVCDNCTELKRFCECKLCSHRDCPSFANPLSEHRLCTTHELEDVEADYQRLWRKLPVDHEALAAAGAEVKVWTELRKAECAS